MSECPFVSMLSAYHDDELPIEARLRIEQHLDGPCQPCALELHQLRRMAALLSGARDVQLSSETRETLYSLAPAAAQAGTLRLTGWVSGLAAAVLLAGSVWLFHAQTPVPASEVSANHMSLIASLVRNPQEAGDAVADAQLPDYVEGLSSEGQP